jgi:acyl-CoA thioester hydrolase
MFSSETRIRVHYALTDQMGYVYYGHYAQFYEIGRAEAIRQLGYTYRDIEELGIIMPVGSMECKYLLPARYDDLLTVKTIMRELPDSNKVVFFHEIYNEAGEKLNSGSVTLHFMDRHGKRPARIPQPLLEKFTPFFT